ncbi:hypothetical protein DFQ01_11121 [Paenibacillus cellulosilyticus]|uniref:DUF2304 domain-containing protein n=1 Tax=Paenibacillus cellulosilyticus TaxID=375489 RepID=A0A2V2Z0W1_9BACL|nr:DUF2304 domain-containing protein [Paenibacillus cellulosilyticus]PWW00876.1 hypothetical protein DFQ01_11121 [Paenibacillus cellulosilyticus]QKS47536.1 DUF2304 domain-containing protein [Paenibacillus cellulosilyticus]
MSIYILSIAFSVLFLVAVLELVRRQRLKEQYSLLWILFGVLLLVVSFNVHFLERVAEWLDVKYAPALLFLFGLLFCFAFILHLTLVVSKLTGQVLRLSQELAIMKGKHREGEGGTL